MPLLAITVLMFWLQRSLLGRKGYTSVTGKGGERRMIALGPWRWVMLGYALFVCALSVFLPMLVLLQAAFSKACGRAFTLDHLTFHHFSYLLVQPHDVPDQLKTLLAQRGANQPECSLSLRIRHLREAHALPRIEVLVHPLPPLHVIHRLDGSRQLHRDERGNESLRRVPHRIGRHSGRLHLKQTRHHLPVGRDPLEGSQSLLLVVL
jgi:hypothetical protein